MAGRPKSKAAEVTKLEERALTLELATACEIPEQYFRGPTEDPLGRLWRDAMHAAMLASVFLEKLGNALRERAGIDEPSPARKQFHPDE